MSGAGFGFRLRFRVSGSAECTHSIRGSAIDCTPLFVVRCAVSPPDISGFGFRDLDFCLGFGVRVLVAGVRFRVPSTAPLCWTCDARYRLLMFRVSGFGFQVSGVGWGFRSRVRPTVRPSSSSDHSPLLGLRVPSSGSGFRVLVGVSGVGFRPLRPLGDRAVRGIAS